MDISPQNMELIAVRVIDSLERSNEEQAPLYTDVYNLLFTDALLPITETIHENTNPESGEPDRERTGPARVVFVERKKAIRLLRDRFRLLPVGQLNLLGQIRCHS